MRKNIRKSIVKLAAIILTFLTVFPVCTYAGANVVSSSSAYSTTFSVWTRSKWSEALKSTPASITFTQTKGTCKFIDKYGKSKIKVNNNYCEYEIKYTIYNAKGRYVQSGTLYFYGRSKTFALKASPKQTYKYVITVRPRWNYVYSSIKRGYYLGYVWTKPSSLKITMGHDVTGVVKTNTQKYK